MQTATITLKLGGDDGNTIQKWGVTPSEVAVLREIHSSDAVTDIAIDQDEIVRSNKAERQRLMERYGRGDDNGGFKAPVVEAMFPGVAARLYTDFSELEMDDSFYAATSRAAPKTIAQELPDEPANEPVAETAAEPGAAPAEATEPAEDDGIADINDNLFK